MTGFTPLTPIAKSTTTSTAPALIQTSGPGMLPHIPQAAAPKPSLVLEKTSKTTVKEVPKAITASPSPSTSQVVGINAPALEKVAKAPSKASTANSSSLPPNLRPSWPTEQKPEAKAPVLEVSAKPKSVTEPVTRFESPNGMYIVTCDVHTLGCDSVTHIGNTGARKLIHGLFSYAEVMKLEGLNVTEKLVNMVKKRMMDSFPPFLVAGITLGTAVVNIKYPFYDITGDIVATIDITSSDGERKYRTISIKRFRHDMFTSFQV